LCLNIEADEWKMAENIFGKYGIESLLGIWKF
jgi:hypothetical protein